MWVSVGVVGARQAMPALAVIGSSGQAVVRISFRMRSASSPA